MWLCICVWKPAYVTCLPQLLSTLHTEKAELISSASLANQPPPWAPRLCLPLLGFQTDYRVQRAFTWVPGIRTRVFILAQQALSTLSRFPSPEIYNFKLLHFLLLGGWSGHTCGGQRTTGRSWLFASIMWTLGDQIQVISVGDKGFYPPPGLLKKKSFNKCQLCFLLILELFCPNIKNPTSPELKPHSHERAGNWGQVSMWMWPEQGQSNREGWRSSTGRCLPRMHEGLHKNGPHRLMNLSLWFPVGGTV